MPCGHSRARSAGSPPNPDPLRREAPMRNLIRTLRPHATVALGGALLVGLMLLWAARDGGYDADTWYWGGLLLLAAGAGRMAWSGRAAIRMSRSARRGLAACAAYVAWSYLSIAWAASPGDALQGSNRALLYLLVFAAMLTLPWTQAAVRAALLAFVLGVQAIALVLLVRLARGHHISGLVIEGRLTAPT